MDCMKEKLLTILQNEVKPALGCTEPIAVALAGAKARELLGEEPLSARIVTSSNIYKNGMCVGLPGTKRIGLVAAAALGIVGGNASYGLKVLQDLTPDLVKAGEEFADRNTIDITYKLGTDGVYINLLLKGATTEAEVTINNRHDRYIFLRKGEEVILSVDDLECSGSKENLYDHLRVKELYEICSDYTEEELSFLWDGVEMNCAMAEYGMAHQVGGQVGLSIKKAMDSGEMANDYHTNAILWTAAASDARMSGAGLPVMSSSGSGNHGITAILPIAVYSRMHNISRINTLQALAMSHLLTSYIKSYTGRLSAVCGCGVAAATGASFGLAYLMELEYEGMETAVEMMIASVSGMICDGAKAGCAVKLAIAASSAVESCMMAKGLAKLPRFNGIVGRSIEESIKNLGTVCNLGMVETDHVILSVMNEMNQKN